MRTKPSIFPDVEDEDETEPDPARTASTALSIIASTYAFLSAPLILKTANDMQRITATLSAQRKSSCLYITSNEIELGFSGPCDRRLSSPDALLNCRWWKAP